MVFPSTVELYWYKTEWLNWTEASLHLQPGVTECTAVQRATVMMVIYKYTGYTYEYDVCFCVVVVETEILS